MNTIIAIWLVYAALVAFYVLYIAAIQIYNEWPALAPWVKVLAIWPVAAMLLVDVVMQFTLFTLLFWDTPKEPLVTQRLTRYRSGPDGWRKRVAVAICEQALNPFDDKGHC